MKRFRRGETRAYELLPGNGELEVEPGELFTVETEDALGGVIKSKEDLVTEATFAGENQHVPCVGPISVVGAEPGDVLEVEIVEIRVGPIGVMPLTDMWGPFHDSFKYAEGRGPYTKIIQHVPGPSGTTADGRGIYDEQTSWDLQPHIGTIAVAPARAIDAGASTANGQGPFGGNIDCRDICPGSKLQLPVFHPGAQLYIGDVHASMADGEFAGYAVETEAEVDLRCRVINGKSIPWPRIETDHSIIQLCSSRPLEEAVRQAYLWLVDWLVEDFNFSQRDAALQMGANPDVRINVYQMLRFGRLEYTAGVSIAKKHLDREERL